MMLQWYTECRIKFSVLADFPETKEVTYFSHGCASQHKNQKIYLMCQHSSEFRTNAKWVYFATSHGKKPC